MTNRWVINRIGLINFWYYDEEEFEFSGGRLLLRGANGSGKSVTMQSFIPLLLDGNKSPERLDPFGSRARRIENYLLGENESGQNERTGYLFMEFKRQDSHQYLTLGMGLRARQGLPLDFWGFAITDGRRVGKDIYLYKKLGEKIPLSKQELKNRIANGGEVYEKQRDYMAMVNRLLFGFEQLEEYDELIKLLIQIRTPKLSKDFKPVVIYEILRNSLQPLSDEDLRPMSEAIENMDNIKDHLEQLQENRKAAERLNREYTKYNSFILGEKAKEFLQSNKDVLQKIDEEKYLKNEIDNFTNLHKKALDELERLSYEYEAVKLKHRELQAHDSYHIKEEIELKKKNLEVLMQEDIKKNKVLEQKIEREIRLDKSIKVMKDELQLLASSLLEIIEEMGVLAKELFFDGHFFMEEELKKDINHTYDFALFKRDFQHYRSRIREVLKKLNQELAENKRYDLAYGDLEDAKRLVDELRMKVEQASNLLFEIKEEFVEKIYNWCRDNEIFKPTEETLRQLQHLISSYPKTSYLDVLLVLREVQQSFAQKYLTAISNLDAKQKLLNVSLLEKEKELGEWQDKKEPEPLRSESVLGNRQRLKNLKVPFAPFYQVVDFKENVPQELQGAIEEALAKMGILDSLILPESYKDNLWNMDKQSADSYLFFNPQLQGVDLSPWLEPVKNLEGEINHNLVNGVLQNIFSPKGNNQIIYLDELGRYGLGEILQGQASLQNAAKFIGAESRQRYREKIIKELQEEIGFTKEEISRIKGEVKVWQAKQATLDEEFNRFPAKDDLEVAANELKNAQLMLSNKNKMVEEQTKLVDDYYRQLHKTREELRNLAKNLELPLNIAAYHEAEENIIDYSDFMQKLQTVHSNLITQYSHLDTLMEQAQEIQMDLDELRYELGKNKGLIERDKKAIEHLADILEQMDYKSIEEQINGCLKAIDELPIQKEQMVALREENRVKSTEAQNRLQSIKKELYFLQVLRKIKEDGFIAECGLGYVEEETKPGDPAAQAREIVKDWSRSVKSKDEYLHSLQKVYFEVLPQLSEYNLDLKHIFSFSYEDSQFNEKAISGEFSLPLPDGRGDLTDKREFSDEEKAEITKALNNLRRLDIGARIQGKIVNFLNLTDFLTSSVEENLRLMRESDRQLFEDILANTISKKIRARIYHGERWVEKMNRLMDSMNTSSGLTFSLAWRSRPAESEGQLDSSELVALLKSDVNLLRAEDFQRLADHFRSKINQVRTSLEESGVTRTFHNLIKEVLDYRQWFEFRLFYTKTGERKREMTNNVFDRFSGGEKAMAMYVPLFSAVYAKYKGAREDAPRLISLDEAFAGVDENNIRDMFRLIEELELNFLVNSQILWGDYDTVPSLAICELVRPNNADFVSVIRYNWNGKVRELMLKEAMG